jgi:hypothetical protein
LVASAYNSRVGFFPKQRKRKQIKVKKFLFPAAEFRGRTSCKIIIGSFDESGQNSNVLKSRTKTLEALVVITFEYAGFVVCTVVKERVCCA